jgi:uncharacterized protein RhaS with RHS repeats
LNTYTYVENNPLRYVDPYGLAVCPPDSFIVDDPRSPGAVKCIPRNPDPNATPGPGDRCVTAECAANILPNPKISACAECRTDCAVQFANPIPGIGIEKGAGAAGSKFGGMAGELARDAAKKINKISGAYDLASCLDQCKKICKDNQCVK